jgi:hypothetical protein
MFHIELVKKIKTYISYSVPPPPPKIMTLMGNVDKYHTARQAIHDDKMLHRKDELYMP